MKIIGARIYYCKLTGDVIYRQMSCSGLVSDYTLEQACEKYSALDGINIETIDVLKFDYMEYEKLSKDSTGVMVNVATKELEFSYDPLPEIPQEPSEIDAIKDKIDILKAENLRLKEVEKEQDKMIMDNAYKMTILEANMGGI